MNKKILNKPKKIQERYYRRLYYKKFSPYLLKLMLFKLRVQLKYNESKKIKAIDNALEAAFKELNKVDKYKFPNLAKLFNFSTFFLLAERDIQCMHVDAFTHKNPAKRNLSLRIMILTIHERDLNKVLSGRELQEIYNDSNISKDLRESLVKAFRQMKKAQDKANYRFKDIRNITIAHRDEDAYLQYKTISNIKILKLSSILEEYYIASNALIELMPALLQESTSIRSLVKQYFKEGK